MRDTLTMWWMTAMFVLILTASVSGRNREVGCLSSKYEHWQANCYYFNKTAGNITFEDVQNQCFRTWGNLASVLNEAENDYIRTKMSHIDNFWIGMRRLRRNDGSSLFYWVDGSAVVYQNWRTTQPDDWTGGSGPEDCVHYWLRDKWNDCPCKLSCTVNIIGYVCKAATTFHVLSGPREVTGKAGSTETSLHWSTAVAISAVVCLVRSVFIIIVVGTVLVCKRHRSQTQNSEKAEDPIGMKVNPVCTEDEKPTDQYEVLKGH